jgi:hypothetical protein
MKNEIQSILLLSTETMEIEELHTNGGMVMQPVGRHQSVAYKNRIFVVGGYDGISKFNTLSVFDLRTFLYSNFFSLTFDSFTSILNNKQLTE